MSVTPPTDDQIKQWIVTSVGDYNGVVAANIDFIWLKNAVFAPYPPLQELYATRDALELLAGQVWQAVDAAVDDTRENLSDQYDHLKDRIRDLDGVIATQTQMTMAALGLSVSHGPILTVAPVSPPAGYPDANSPRYSGSPYAPLGRW